MQLRGLELTRASRIVIILLVVQHLGLGQVVAVASATATGPDPADPSQSIAPCEAVVSLVVVANPDRRAGSTIGEPRSRTIPPDSLPLPRRLPRAPPAD